MPRNPLRDDELESMRQRLSGAALQAYLEEGLEGVSFRRLADAVGVSHTLPYRYFENKEALFARVRTDAVMRFDAFLRARESVGQSGLEIIRSVAYGYVEYARLHTAEYMLIFSTHQPPPDQYPELLAARRHLFDHAVDVVDACVRSGQLSGNAREIAHGVWIALHGLMTLHGANQLVHGFKAEQLIDPILERLLGSPAEASRSGLSVRRSSSQSRRRTRVSGRK